MLAIDSSSARRALGAALPVGVGSASPGLIVSVVAADGLLASSASGLASLEHNVPVAESTVFYLASTSKQFTAACVLLAADLGRLSCSDRLRTHVPELPEWADEITIDHLMSHSAGLPEYGDLIVARGQSTDAPLTDEAILDLLVARGELVYPPGTRCEYSNTAFWLLGVVTGRATGTSLRTFGNQHLFQPLGMQHTWYRDDRWEVIANLAEGYMPVDQDAGYRRWRTCFDRVGDGGVVSSISDLARWESAALSNGSTWSALCERLAKPRPLLDRTVSDWRAGLLVGAHRGHAVVMAGGTGFGYRSFSVRVATEGVSVVALSNLGTADVRTPAFRALDELLP